MDLIRMASQQALIRLRKEFQRLSKQPLPFVEAQPLESNLLDWHYVITGPPGTVYEGGCYHGMIVFPTEYPFRPPSILMLTPSGRFETNTRLCLSMSDYHPETWNPMWSVSSIITGLLSFMLEDERTTGSIETTAEEKRTLAKHSHSFNVANRKFTTLFPQYVSKK